MAIRGVIFDMDGTLTTMCFDFAKIKAEAGVGDVDLLDYLDTVRGAERARLMRIIVKHEERAAAHTRLNRGARTLLRGLRKRGLPTALLTRNSRRSVELVCRRLGLEFDVSLTREDAPHKPSPEPIRRIARRWRAKPRELLMVGDYKWDVLCARNAGARSVLFVGNAPLPPWAGQAEFVIRRLTEVLDIVDKEQG
ncbi:MAG: HAD family hydrolase [Verrucomicrobiae bacterium]|nr:HAD family hydrolase [Verrucomicrobiae bacterium]